MGLDPKSLLSFLTILIHGVSVTRAALRNITIDDTFGDEVTHVVPAYLPAEPKPDGYNSTWAGPECTRCPVRPNPKRAYNGTWHAMTYHPEFGSISIQFPFTGTTIYVFFIVPTEVACNFSIDGRQINTFYLDPSALNSIYNYPALVQTGLDNVAHTMKIEAGNGYSEHSYVAFDYAIYTYDDSAGPLPSAEVTSTFSPSSTPSPSSTSPPSSTSSYNNSKHVNLAAIVGGVVGGVAFIALLALLFLAFSRRKRSSSSPEIRPEMTSPAYDTGHGPASDTAAASNVPSYYRRDKQSHPNMSSPGMTPNAALSTRQYDQLGPSRTQQTTDELKRARQRELQGQLEGVKAEMRALQADLQENGGAGAITERNMSVRSQTRERNDQEVLNLKEQIRVMGEQMEALRLQLDSAWAQGLSDEPPPGYTPHVSGS